MSGPDKMDDLLAKLRRSMAELSVQGDDFARQMCQMYAIFEEVVGPQLEPQPPPLRENPIRLLPRDARARQTPLQQAILPLPSLRESPVRQDSPTRIAKRTTALYGSPGVRRRRIPQPAAKAKTKNMSMEQYRPTRPHHQRSLSDSSSSNNPLLDTISVLTYDPNEDSDDYYDFSFARPRASTSSTGQDDKRGSDLDRDSVGYAGSNSVDSGYKSLCPTPEIPEGSYDQRGACAVPDTLQSLNTLAGTTQDKTKIMMGTKVMEFQKPKGRKMGSSYYDVDLDHLMYLRESLLSAIQKCETVKTEESTSSYGGSITSSVTTASSSGPSQVESSPGPVTSKTAPTRERRRSEPKSPKSSSSDSSPSSQKTVRFDTDIRVTGSPKQSPRPTRKQSKSILKDPLCANIRSQLTAAEAGCSFEEEIDALLYGKAEYYDLESVRDFPCSYVTMIEEKYKCGKASVARVKRLKDSGHGCGNLHGRLEQPTSPSKTKEQRPNEVDVSIPPGTPTTPSKQSRTKPQKEPGKSKKRFTEVARCMLEILEDIQFKRQSNKPTSPGNQQSTLPRSWKSKRERKSVITSSTQATTSEFHVYEEIMYDFVGGCGLPSDHPPPLPARPTGLFKETSPGEGPAAVRNFRSHTYSGNRPKQRSNLYSLFSDQVERRHLSKSLEQEWRNSGYQTLPPENDDDYGFRSAFPAL